MIIAFDVDGTLINFDNTPNYRVINIMRWFIANGERVYIWSGGGYMYAYDWAQKLGFGKDENGISKVWVSEKTKEAAERIRPDVCFDDEFVELAKVNIHVTPNFTPIV